MAKVINDVVKMDWEKSGWYQISVNKGKKTVFVYASQEYDSSNQDDPVTVFFTPFCAFIMETDEGLWDAKDFSTIDSSLLTGIGFPNNIDGVVPILEAGDHCDMEVLEKYGIEDYADDIEARRLDVRGYAEEKDVDPSAM